MTSAERLPIIYVRGYAGPPRGIDKQVDDPFYGFNAGATHVRMNSDRDPRFYQFESPILRLMTDEGYTLLVHGDQHVYLESRPDRTVPPASIWVHRFYDYAASTFGTSIGDTREPFDLEQAAERLYDLVQLVRRKTGAPKVYLVAHSMGGLIARCMIEKVARGVDPRTGQARDPASELVDKLFTYGTPHGGIVFDIGGGLVDWAMETFGPYGSDIFAPHLMYGYLTPGVARGTHAPEGWQPNEIAQDAFDVRRVFCLVGTDATDYGLVEKAIGPPSDGLVRVGNASVLGAHSAFVHRAHSGRYGLVNSEEGYQNLRRFLFGSYEARLDLTGLALPDPQAPHAARSWQAEVRVAVRGLPIVLHEQLSAHCCPIQLGHGPGGQRGDAPVPVVALATVFLLDPARFRTDDAEAPPRRRYTLTLRVLHLTETHRGFLWEHHLEQVADWEDTLIVDVGRRDDDPETAMRVWTAWNSALPGAAEDHDPVSAENHPFDGDGFHCDIAPPPVACPVLGEGARLRLTVSRRR
ncbi:esterase/lipase family protein [Dactylosporangium sp. CA-092794]|uniref:esterase/lipase family protein n=1 Tax=Dactylosporangium sp. CA-092794 TaxID=3239929 RepID=UPI003D8B04C3